MDLKTKKALLNHLLEFITDKRNSLFDEVLSYRTKHIAVVLEDIYQSQNASAVLRTCDLTGIQDVHIIENKNKYDVNPDVAVGSSKWLNLIKYNSELENTEKTIHSLKKEDYRIIATTPHKKGQSLDEIPLDGKMAFMFGTELNGLSDTAIKLADELVHIPMYGFTESYNISVSAALLLFTLTQKLRKSEIMWQLTDEEKIKIKLDWARNTIRRSEVFERQFLKKLK